jgi:signal transduction histidine kinase
VSDEFTNFSVKTGLKNIIGSELVTDDFVAVFELVKNSFDAHAKRVVVRFENIRQPDMELARLTIQDDGKGMTRADLNDKWLAVAYSAKKHNKEDADIENDGDYRDLIGAKRPFAGAKGIGRFSCDRLGTHLKVYTRRNPSDAEFEWVKIDWEDFEKNETARFEDVKIRQGTVDKIPFVLERGTVLEITGLRKIWSREELTLLRTELQKLINPGDGSESSRFTIIIEVPEEASKDSKCKKDEEKINGPVKNFLFDRLNLKTTKLQCNFSESGNTIETVLSDQGEIVYRLVEGNDRYPDLAGVSFLLYYLNKAAKLAFRKTVGVPPIEFGSIFVYKNGFRVQPYGREDDDSFVIDRRKVQGTSRYLGSRDLIGRIEVNCDNTKFKEASSRNAGFIESAEAEQLVSFLMVLIRRLESYVVDVIRWGNPVGKSLDASKPLTAADNRDAMLELTETLTQSKNVVNFEAGKDLVKIVTERQAEGAASLVENFERLASEQSNEKLANEAKRIRREMEAILAARVEAEKEARTERGLRVIGQQQIAVERERNQVLTGLIKPGDEQQMILKHWVKIVSTSIITKAASVIPLLHGDPDAAALDRAITTIVELKTEAQKLQKVSSLIEGAGFNDAEEVRKRNLARFFWEYLDHEKPFSPSMSHEIRWNPDSVCERLFRPLDLALVIDNLASNSRKSGAGLMRWEVTAVPHLLRVRVANDGSPMREEFINTLFSLGASSTKGTGIGLYTCRLLLSQIGADIIFAGNDPLLGGAAFELSFPE